MDVLVGTLYCFILGTNFLLVHIGVSQSMIAEVLFLYITPTNFSVLIHPKMTDSSNIGDAVAFEPLMWSVGSTIA